MCKVYFSLSSMQQGLRADSAALGWGVRGRWRWLERWWRGALEEECEQWDEGSWSSSNCYEENMDSSWQDKLISSVWEEQRGFWREMCWEGGQRNEKRRRLDFRFSFLCVCACKPLNTQNLTYSATIRAVLCLSDAGKEKRCRRAQTNLIFEVSLVDE